MVYFLDANIWGKMGPHARGMNIYFEVRFSRRRVIDKWLYLTECVI